MTLNTQTGINILLLVFEFIFIISKNYFHYGSTWLCFLLFGLKKKQKAWVTDQKLPKVLMLMV